MQLLHLVGERVPTYSRADFDVGSGETLPDWTDESMQATEVT